ncbi:uncharacterized protein LOC118757413 [Rhagoletis pomonella]|uniref:uncharacterized protein LOC118757413 n=1 Tax=Rhagoletis pomonella TaxID=28610 RepID=UPI001785CC89|nr:uncharacterized protein LOC118757413 [Rhagoletis pomonella]
MEESRQSTAAGGDHMNAIIVTLNALRASVEELRNSTMESQRDIIRLREDMQPPNEIGQSATLQPAQGESSQMVVPATDSQVKLYDLPTFGGNAEEWSLFFANFNDTTEAFRYSHRQNLMRLQKCLVGAAKEAVASLLIYPEDVPNVLNELQFRFGRPDILVKWQLNKLQQFPTIPEHKPEQIVPFSTRVRNVVAFLKSAKSQQHLANVSLLEQMICKLPQNKQFDWAKHAVDIKPYPTIEDFSKWLSELARVVCLMPTSSAHSHKQNTSASNPRRVMHIQDERPTETVACSQCGGDHLISKCDKFKALSVQARWEVVKSRQLCFSCLRKGHSTSKCRSKRSCGINSCQRYHNQLLHNDESRLNTSRQITQDENTQPLLNCRLVQAATKQLFKMLPVNIYGPNGKFAVLAMFDEGSAITILEEAVAKRIGVKGQCHPLTLQWYDDRVVTEQSFKVSLEIAGCSSNKRFTLRDVRTVKNLNLPEQSFTKDDFEHLRELPLQDYHSTKPVLLIGLNQAHLGVTTTIVQADIGSPLAAKTSLGWVAYGPTKLASTSSLRVLHMREWQHLHQLVSDYITTDNYGFNPASVKLESDVDKHAKSILEATTRIIGKRYETGLLWKMFPPHFPSSREMAERRLLSVERRMHQDAEFALRYKQEMSKYVAKGYARKLTSQEISAPYAQAWYLPHFAVFNPSKPSKLRIVFDAAATVNKVSLNSVLLKGPEQAQPLIRILLQFRQGEIGVAADIKEMFSQVKVRPMDQHAQRYLWRDGDSNQPIEEYMMTSMIFGAVCSPCIAEHVKNKNAERFRIQFPEAASIVINKHYVDDLIVAINSEAGFELRNFISNCGYIEKAMNKTPLTTREVINMERNQTADKVLASARGNSRSDKKRTTGHSDGSLRPIWATSELFDNYENHNTRHLETRHWMG